MNGLFTFEATSPNTATLLIDEHGEKRYHAGRTIELRDGRWEFHGVIDRRRRQRDGRTKLWLTGHEGPVTSSSGYPYPTRMPRPYPRKDAG